MQRYERFVLSPIGRAPGNEYRITGGRVEFRCFQERPTHKRASAWRTLSPDDILMHLSLNTEVGKWLLKRLQRRMAA